MRTWSSKTATPQASDISVVERAVIVTVANHISHIVAIGRQAHQTSLIRLTKTISARREISWLAATKSAAKTIVTHVRLRAIRLVTIRNDGLAAGIRVWKSRVIDAVPKVPVIAVPKVPVIAIIAVILIAIACCQHRGR